MYLEVFNGNTNIGRYSAGLKIWFDVGDLRYEKFIEMPTSFSCQKFFAYCREYTRLKIDRINMMYHGITPGRPLSHAHWDMVDSTFHALYAKPKQSLSSTQPR